MAEEIRYTANTGMTTIETANANLDGTGNLGTLLTAAENGTTVNSVIIKARGNTTVEGMIRLFIFDGTNSRLFAEIEIPIVTQSATDPCFERHVALDLNLKSGYILKVGTQIANTFNIIAEGLDWSYNAAQIRTDTTKYTANTGMVNISTANTNLNGTGTLGTVLTAGTTANGWKGCRINSITVKAMQTTTKGMVRLFIQDTISTKRLFAEILVSRVTFSSKEKSFETTVFFDNALNIAPGYSILASTEVGESFFVTADAEDWTYES